MDRVSADDFADLAFVSDPAVSPDGDRVAYVRRTADGDEEYDASVFVVPLGGGDPRRFTAAEGVDAEPRWSPDGDHLAFTSTRGDRDEPQLYVLPTDGGEARRVTDVVGGVSDVAWRPDGERLAFVQRARPAERADGHDCRLGEDYERADPDPRVVDATVYRSDGEYHDGGRRHVYVTDLAGDVTRATAGDRDHVAPTWGDGDLYWAAKRGEDPDDSDEWAVVRGDPRAGETETVTTTTDWEPALDAAPDGRVAVTRTPADGLAHRQREVDVVDPATGEATTVTDGLDRTVELGPTWDPDGERLFVATPDEGAVVLRRLDPDGGDVTDVVTDCHVDGFDVGSDAVAVTASEWDHPGDVFAATPGGAERVRLTRVNAGYLEGRAVAEPEEVWFEGGDGEIQGWVLTPPDVDPDETYPLAVEIHGGPHAMWSTSGTMWHEFQTLAARGYVVFWCNPRGSTGYGEDFTAANVRDWGAVTAADVLAGADRVCERDAVDPDAQFVTGGSFGGFATAWLVGQTDRFDGAVTQRGVYDLASFYGSTDAFSLVEDDFETVPWADPTALWEQSPVSNVASVTTPTLLLHADHDYRVPVNNAEMLYLFLRKNGVDTRLVRYPREGHELSRSGEPGHRVDRIERIVRWFDGYSSHHDAAPVLEEDDD